MQWWRTHDTTEDVALVGVLVLHAEVGEDGGLILGNGGVVELLDLGELVGVDEEEGGAADELVWFIACVRGGERTEERGRGGDGDVPKRS